MSAGFSFSMIYSIRLLYKDVGRSVGEMSAAAVVGNCVTRFFSACVFRLQTYICVSPSWVFPRTSLCLLLPCLWFKRTQQRWHVNWRFRYNSEAAMGHCARKCCRSNARFCNPQSTRWLDVTSFLAIWVAEPNIYMHLVKSTASRAKQPPRHSKQKK